MTQEIAPYQWLRPPGEEHGQKRVVQDSHARARAWLLSLAIAGAACSRHSLRPTGRRPIKAAADRRRGRAKA